MCIRYSNGEMYSTVYFVLRFLVVFLPVHLLDPIAIISVSYSEQILLP